MWILTDPQKIRFPEKKMERVYQVEGMTWTKVMDGHDGFRSNSEISPNKREDACRGSA